jgi:hypothetical protein
MTSFGTHEVGGTLKNWTSFGPGQSVTLRMTIWPTVIDTAARSQIYVVMACENADYDGSLVLSYLSTISVSNHRQWPH